MDECKLLENCPFFLGRLKNMPALAKMYRKTFCRGDFERCARYRVRSALGSEAVPDDLFPNMEERVEGLISTGPSAAAGQGG